MLAVIDRCHYRPTIRQATDLTRAAGSCSYVTKQSNVVAESNVATGRVDPADIATRRLRLSRAGQAVGYGHVYKSAVEMLAAGYSWEEAAVGDLTPWNGATMPLPHWRRQSFMP